MMKLICVIFARRDIFEKGSLGYRVLLVFLVCVINVSQQTLDFPKEQLDGGAIDVCHTLDFC